MIVVLRVLAFVVPLVVATQVLRSHHGALAGPGDLAWFEWFYIASGAAFGAIMYWVSRRLDGRN